MRAFFCYFLLLSVFLPFGVSADSSALFFDPANGRHASGDYFFVDVMADTQGENVNAIGAYVSYPSDLLEVVSVDTTGSPMEFIVERNYGLGSIEISGGSPTPGFSGVYHIATVEFHALEAGKAELSFLPASAVITDAGNQNIFDSSPGAIYEIGEATSSTSQEYVSSAESIAYVSPMEIFSDHSLLASLLGSAGLVADFLFFIAGLSY